MNQDTSNRFLLKVLERLLCPIVRLCLRQSIKLQEILEVLKVVLVRCAREQVEQEKGEISLSKLSAMSGVHRKDVTRIERSDDPVRPKVNIFAKLIVQWQHDRRFNTASRKPRVLNTTGRDSEFAQLVNAVNGANLNPYTVLNEMERAGLIVRIGNRARLASKLYLAETGHEEGLDLLSADLNDLVAAVEDNLYLNTSIKNLHLKTEFDSVIESALPEVQQWLLDRGSSFHAEVRRYLAKFDTDLNPRCGPSARKVRVVFGTFGRAHLIEENR